MDSTSVIEWNSQLNDAPRPFDIVSENLQALGALSIDTFLAGPDPLYHPPLRSTSPVRVSPTSLDISVPVVASKSSDKSTNTVAKAQPISELHRTCQRVFGSAAALKFEFVEEDGPNSKQCILTITRPNGLARSYKTEPTFSRKGEAKARVAEVAIGMGAVEFITNGDSDVLKAKKGQLLFPLDEGDAGVTIKHSAESRPKGDKLINEIERCCLEWRAGIVKPQWFSFNDPKTGDKYGAALRIRLAPHAFRVYSSNPDFDNPATAKAACAQVALDEGVIEYIKHGNGQAQPASPGVADMDAKDDTTKVTAQSLQGFYETLAQPFAEPVDGMTAAEINASVWLNTIVQGGRGTRLRTTFIGLTNRALGLHGCVLRLDRPGECKSYLVDTLFQKRSDAKAAVCLLAMSQGVGNYVRSMKTAVENKITPEARKLANTTSINLAKECSRIQPGAQPEYDFTMDRDAHGCTLKISLMAPPAEPIVRDWTVPPDYRSKADAKAAVSCLAAEEGVMELLRFQGKTPPPDYVSFWESEHNRVSQPSSSKRKDIEGVEHTEGDHTEGPERKKKKNTTIQNDQASKSSGNDSGKKSRKRSRAHASTNSMPSKHSGPGGGSANQGEPENRNLGRFSAFHRGPVATNRHGFSLPQPFPSVHHEHAPPPDGLGYGRGHTAYQQFTPSSASEPFSQGAFPFTDPRASAQFAGGAMHTAPQYLGMPSSFSVHSSRADVSSMYNTSFPHPQQYPMMPPELLVTANSLSAFRRQASRDDRGTNVHRGQDSSTSGSQSNDQYGNHTNHRDYSRRENK